MAKQKKIIKKNTVPDLTFEQILARIRPEGQEIWNTQIYGGRIEGAQYKTSISGPRIEIKPDDNGNIGLVIYDDAGNKVFESIIAGDDVGDINIGDVSGGNGIQFDKSAGEIKINNTKVNFTFEPDYGEGSDGDVTISSNTSLSKDTYYNDLTIDSGKTLTTAGYRLYVAGTLTVNGTIDFSGNDGQGSVIGTSTGGAALSDVNIGGSGAGGDGEVGNGTAGTSVNPGFGGAGGQGGDSGFTGGGGGGVTNPTIGIRSAPFCYMLTNFPSNTLIKGGAGGGGGAGTGGGGTNGGGAGGSGGGVMLVAAKEIVVAVGGTITVAGGDGGDGFGGGGVDTGGGGGGGGGLMILIYSSLTNNGTISVAGGAKGIGGKTTGAPADDGVDGTIGLKIDLQN